MKFEFSAGGVVFKCELMRNKSMRIDPSAGSGQVLILIAQHSQHHGWVFPKGFIGDKIAGESKEATALREVEEETGAVGKILEPLTPVTYWYQMDGVKRRKTVYYYVMEYVDGDITKHDWEMENVEWLPMDQVEDRLTYDSDKKVWSEAQDIIKRIAYSV